jgi:hypothetical protein
VVIISEKTERSVIEAHLVDMAAILDKYIVVEAKILAKRPEPGAVAAASKILRG